MQKQLQPISFHIENGKETHKDALLVIPYWSGKEHPELALGKAAFKTAKLNASEIEPPILAKDFKAGLGETFLLYPKHPHFSRIVLLGLGKKEEITQERLRRSFGSVARFCHKYKCTSLHLLTPEAHLPKSESLIRGIAEGLLLANYLFTALRQDALKEEAPKLLEKVTFLSAPANYAKEANHFAKIASGVYLARDLVNQNADLVTPSYLAKAAAGLAKKYRTLKCTVFDKKRLEKEKMGLLLAVNRGSKETPALIILEYKGASKSKENTVIVGKGVTYDTGGLSLKPTESMLTMKCDMSGAAAVLGTLSVVAELGLKVNVVGVIPTTDNMIGPDSYKVGDVYTSYAGKTVEIGNTDAEGRLILADALSYAVKHYKPAQMFNFATLTGAIDIALGNEASGMFCNNDGLAKEVQKASESTFERVWPMPLFPEYAELLKSDIADLRNIGGRSGGSITAAKFLEAFVGKTPWAHFDIASTAFLGAAKSYLPKHATGVGVRLMVEFLKNREK